MESKNLLSKDEYERLLNFFQVKKNQSNQQINYYFETDDLKLKANGAALRIREKNSNWVLTLKEPYQEGLIETHQILTEKEAQHWIAGSPTSSPNIEKRLQLFEISCSKLKFGGTLKTDRIELPYEGGLVVLDYSEYNGQYDYELEIEANTMKQSESIMQVLLNKLNIKQKPTPNKIERFYHTLKV